MISRILAQVAAVSPQAVITKEIPMHISESYPNLINSNEIPDGRMKIGGAICARKLGKNVDDDFKSDSSDSMVPIFKGIIVGVDRLMFW